MATRILSPLCSSIKKSLQSFGAQAYSTAPVSSFKASDVEITRTTNPAPKPEVSTLKFGHHFSDHMLEIDYTSTAGWGKPRICPVHNLSLHPAAKCLHYAVELFEGMKAFRGDDDRIRLFRPMENMQRMLRTSERSCLPLFDGRELVELIKKLISIDADWPQLGVSRSSSATLFVLIGPVGPYYPTGMAPVKLLADPKFVRAWPGGSGGFKMGSNYAPTMAVQNVAAEKGCQQVLWLFGDDHQLTEVGAMNLFTFWLLEMFGAGTACVVSPVEGVLYNGEMLKIPTMTNPYVTNRCMKELLDIQLK
ncbi:BCAT2-like protein [Mya arenaria]|uniref:BCAT2-like protein n=1 Tax=Mya arenaria TaxID=6604 RepID=A0ABY7DY04_MYAAR|nr:BCAT2-like protein [Mya arenaria]